MEEGPGETDDHGSRNRRRVWVTGAASGLGRAITLLFAQEGAAVVAFDRDAGALQRLRLESANVDPVVVDVGDAAALEVALAQAGGDVLDVLVNCVGVAGATSPLAQTSLEDWRRTMDVNITSHFLCARAAAPLIARAGGGAIVNISSTSARTGLPERTPYVVSKAAVIALSTNLARELGVQNIRVNAVLPGPMSGERLDGIIRGKAEALGVSDDTFRAQMLRYISMRTLVTPGEVAKLVEFLASDGARHITGQVISVDGNVEYEP